MNIILSIDPGLTGTGIAVWDEAKWKELVPPLWVKTYYPDSRLKDWQDKSRDVCLQVFVLLQDYCNKHSFSADNQTYISKTICEFQEFHQGSAKGYAATAEGSITKLSYFTGSICTIIRHKFASEIELVYPTQWMGQLTDKAMRFRMEQRLGKEVCDKLNIKSHAVDATCLGLYAKGFWLQK